MAAEPTTSKLPEHVRREVQRILDRAARRLLAEQLAAKDADTVATKGEVR
jgi:hypothetical protein